MVDISEEEEWSIVQGALQILTVADCLTSRTSVLVFIGYSFYSST